jgi:type III restriction enzyme
VRVVADDDQSICPEGQPFPWLVSDFGVVDAIESGIVKIPRLPVSDDSGKKDEVGRPDPKYFRLWYHIVGGLARSEKGPAAVESNPISQRV